MSTKLTQGLTLGLIGATTKKRIVPIRDTICWRKPANRVDTRKVIKRYKYAIGMVSAHNIYRKYNTPFCKIWCHCFRDVNKYLPGKPSILLSESDFVDPLAIKTPVRPLKYDFYYFTTGGKPGSYYKGMNLFVDSLPILCGELGLKGLVVKYAKPKRPFLLNRKQQRIWKQYSKSIRFLKGKKNTASIMSICKFGFFPNIKDCSPLLLSESLVRNIPILVNENILGGWKYVNDETGALFDGGNLKEKTEFLLNTEFNTREEYMKKYGYKNSATRLANFCKKHISSFEKYSMVGFAGTSSIMKQYNT